LPFGFYPITKTRKAGLIIPQDFDFRSAEGFGLENFGWYQPINQYMDARVMFRAYTGGTVGITGDLNYNRKYYYQGNFNLSYNNRVIENSYAEREKNKSFGIRWTHSQDSKAHPTRKFSGSVNIETNRNQNRNRNDFQSVYQNQLRSNMNYSQTFPGKPYSLTVGLAHDQNVQTRQMNVTLPTATFQMQQIFPFKRKNPVGKERWYEKLALSYNSKLQNTLTTTDTALFTRATLESARMGIQHSARTNVALKVLKYVNISPSLDYEENWYPYSTRKELLPENRLVYRNITDPETGQVVGTEIDTAKSQFGIDTTYRVWGFNAFRTYNAGISANTTLFFTKQFKKGWFRGIRHKMTPSISTGFGPDFTKSRYNYFREVQTDTRPKFNDTLTYSIFENNIYGRPSSSPRQMAINWSLGNLLEMKYKGRRDSVARKVRIFDNLGFSGSYRITADSLKWSTVSTGGLFRFFKGITNIQWGVTFDPYIADERGRQINRFMIREKGRLVRTTNFNMSLNNNFTINQLRDIFKGKQVEAASANNQKSDQLINWFDTWGVTHRIEVARRLIPTGVGEARDTFIISNHSLGVTGNLQLNAKWTLRLGNISYDFPSKRLVYPDIGISRDLHCWELNLSWQPDRGTYLFNINVKPGTLGFLKLPYRKNNFDGF
ncbi:MAG: hypothetical protein IT269_01645, partial [Saprospiraceae bacterium]|nr:hypothetical protein [Saprospiraceae bacterium]